MSKEIVFSVIIVIVIVVSDILVGRFVDSRMDDEISKLEELKKIIQDGDYEQAREKFNEINDSWYSSENVFSFVLEHDELEKVSTELTSLGSYIALEDDTALESASKATFIIRHIEEKNDLKLKNIF